MTQFIGRDAFLSLQAARLEVDVSEWWGEGKKLLIRELTAAERDEYEASILNSKATRGKAQDLNLKNARARLVVLALINEDGSRMFRSNEAHIIGNLPGRMLDYLYDRVREFSDMMPEVKQQNEDGEAASEDGEPHTGETRRLVENFGHGPNGSSSTD